MNSRQQLEQLSRNQEEGLEKELSDLAEKGKNIATQALLVAGGIALVYMIYRAFDSDSGKSKKKKKSAIKVIEDNDNEGVEEQSWFGEISTTLAKEAALFLLVMAKDRLVDYLNSRNEPSEGNTEKKNVKS